MSFYMQLAGTITFKEQEDFKKVVAELKQWVYLSEDETTWLDEMEGPQGSDKDHQIINKEQLSIEFEGYHRNIGRLLDPLLKDMSFTGELLGASTDGCFEGYIKTGDGKEEITIDLNNYGQSRLGFRVDPEVDEDFGQLQQEIIEAFFDKPHWEPNSVHFIKNS